MARPLLALALDSADVEMLTSGMDEGHLPRLAELRDRGGWGLVDSCAQYAGETAPLACTETLWTMFHTGMYPHRTGCWSTIHYDPLRYRSRFHPQRGFEYREAKPFYALGRRRRVVTFDMPMTELRDDIEGLQVQTWGGHAPFARPGSRPARLLPELNRRHGRNEVVFRDYGYFWRRNFLDWLRGAMQRSIERRVRVMLDLMQRAPWDLFLTSIGEIHGAEHIFWFADRKDHPLHQVWQDFKSSQPLLDVFRKIDEAVGRIVDAAPEANVLLFSLHGMTHNVTDLASMALLPELIYRFNFPDRQALPNETGELSPPLTAGLSAAWTGEVWRRRYLPYRWARWLAQLLPPWAQQPIFPFEQLQTPYRPGVIGQAMWIPASWYRRHWPKMRSFALPAFSDGWIRLNVRGRDPQGIVDPHEYGRECERIRRFLLRCRNPRTGRPLVERVVRTRRNPLDPNPKLPAAGLVVQWCEEPADVVESPDVGRVGPLPYQRTGGHRPGGFWMLSGPDFSPGSSLPEAQVTDLSATILSLVGEPVPDYLDGQPLVEAYVER